MVATKPDIENVNKSAINRRPILDFVQRGVFDAELLSHLARYGKAVDLIRQLSKQQERPIRVLDIGCGELWPLRSIIGNPFLREDLLLDEYIGVDIEAPDLSFLSSRTPFHLIQQDLTVNPEFTDQVADKEIDLIICLEFIEHVDKPFVLKIFDEMERVLRSEGLVFLSTPNDDHGRDQQDFHVYEWGFKELKEELSKRWLIEDYWGTFMRQNSVNKANRESESSLPPPALQKLRKRFDATWYRVITASMFPEAAENVAWLLSKVDLEPANSEQTNQAEQGQDEETRPAAADLVSSLQASEGVEVEEEFAALEP